jgi:hypothetical protein
MVRLRQMGADLRRIIQGTAAFYRYLREPECIHLGLGLFSADTSTVALGERSRYCARLANVSGETHNVTTCIEFYTMNRLQHIEEHCGHLAKSFTMQAHTVAVLEVQYDWLAQAFFFLDGVPSLPDELWHIDVFPPLLCSVHALLLDSDGCCLEQLTIFQEVTG